MSTSSHNLLFSGFQVSKWFDKNKTHGPPPPFTLAVFRNDTRQLLFGADANIDPITGSLCLDNGMYKGMHRQVWTLRDERKSGEAGGTFEGGGKWIARTFTVFDGMVGMGIALVGNNTILMDPGTYKIEAFVPALGVGDHQCRWVCLEGDGETLECPGSSETSSSDEVQSKSMLCFTLHVTGKGKAKKYQLQHRCTDGRPGDGFGKPCGFKDSMEVYSIVKIERKN